MRTKDETAKSMRNIPTAPLPIVVAGTMLALHACALIATPMASAVMGGAQLAIKGAELRTEIRKADAQEAIDMPFDQTWDASFTALAGLDIEIVKGEKNLQEDGGVIEASARKTKIKVVVVTATEKVTEIGVWAAHDKALAQLIADKITEEAEEQTPPRSPDERACREGVESRS